MGTLGSRLKYFREVHKDISQEELAEILGVKQAHISQWESDKGKPKGEAMLLLQRAFPELDTNWLISGEGDMLIKPQNPLTTHDIPDSLSLRLLGFLERTEQRFDKLLNNNELVIKNNERVTSALIEMSTALIGKIKGL